MKKFFLFLTLILTSIWTQAGLFDQKNTFLKADDAFQFSAEAQGKELTLFWQIADGYYLYKKEINIQTENAVLGELQFPQPENYEDEFFGKVEIFREQLKLTIPLLETTKSTRLTVIYQGCTKGFCYPPEEKIVDLSLLQNTKSNMANTIENQVDLQQKTEPTPTALSMHKSEQNELADSLFRSKYAVFWFFLLGLGLAFTPCVLPMLPLLSAIVIGQGERPNTARAFALSIVYVQGMALTYTLLGLIVAAIGLPFQVALQSPIVLITLSILFIFLSLSMFGVFTLQLPTSLQTKLTQISQQQKSGAYGGVFVMGMLAGLVASPCTSAPLSGALLYVAQSGDLFIGGVTLYLLALGMGTPLILITVFGNKILPKSGEWMNVVKELFGFILLLLPVFLLERVFSTWAIALWGVWAILFLCWLANKRYWLGVIVALSSFFAIQQVDLPFLSKSAVQKQADFQPHFVKVQSYDELQHALNNNPKKLAMLDLYADWCVACKEFEKYTFSDPKVQQAFENILLLQVDMTKNSPKNTELMKKLDILGLPTILFFDQKGQEITNARVTGFMPAETFLNWIQQYY
ncbi:MAG: protein-disulfide reductase DsbD [Lonepinella koalarum]|nr:protein-disulfide reductase DsbD [Lonepinella koalarum]